MLARRSDEKREIYVRYDGEESLGNAAMARSHRPASLIFGPPNPPHECTHTNCQLARNTDNPKPSAGNTSRTTPAAENGAEHDGAPRRKRYGFSVPEEVHRTTGCGTPTGSPKILGQSTLPRQGGTARGERQGAIRRPMSEFDRILGVIALEVRRCVRS